MNKILKNPPEIKIFNVIGWIYKNQSCSITRRAG